MATPALGEVSLERMVRAVEKVRERLLRATSALDEAGVAYAVAGGNAVAAWVSRIDEAAVRNTRDVDLLLRREDAPAAAKALHRSEIIPHPSSLIPEATPQAGARDAVHVLFAGEKVRHHYSHPAPDVEESERAQFRLLTLEALVRMKLTSFRDRDRTHLRDMLEIGLIDRSWLDRWAGDLSSRLQELIENPED